LPQTKARIVSKVIAERVAEMPNAFSVISPGMVRIRPGVNSYKEQSRE
jgi:hypothetical protein